MNKILAATMAVVVAIGITVCVTTEEWAVPTKSEFVSISDSPNTHITIEAEPIIQLPIEAQEQEEPQVVEYIEPEYYEPVASYPVYSSAEGLNSYDGIYNYGGHTETYYASYAAYDSQLWVDEEGFFRDSDGRYVVSTDDYEQGAVVDISKGEAVVMDCGTAPGVVDVHTVWGR